MSEPFTVVSGGQTGVDRAALDAAKFRMYRWGGWCPRGRLDENGKIPDRYFSDEDGIGLVEGASSRAANRTKLNIRDSDGTLVLFPSGRRYSPGTKLTISETRKRKKPLKVVDPSKSYDEMYSAVRFIISKKIRKLNIAGSRESKLPGIHAKAFQFLVDLFHIFDMYELYGIELWSLKQRKKE